MAHSLFNNIEPLCSELCQMSWFCVLQGDEARECITDDQQSATGMSCYTWQRIVGFMM